MVGDQGFMRGNLQSKGGLLAKIVYVARMISAAAALSFVFLQNAIAETRTLKIYYVHTNERYEITFKRNGVYLPDGLKKLNYALRDWRRNEPTKMDPHLFDLIWEVYQRVGTNEYINVVCGYRAAATNSMLRHRSKGVAEKSQHILGKAMDYFIPGVSLKKLRYTGLQMQVGGVGYYPTSGSPFVHMDVGRVRHWPRMSRSELMAVFPDGKTIHIPSDGKPLAGYEVALAAYQAHRGSGGSSIASAIPSGKKRTLLQALFGGGGADESEDNAGDESVAVAEAAPKPVKQQAAPVEPDPAPIVPQQPVIVATLPRRDKNNDVAAPRPDADLTGQEPQILAFAVPVPSKKPRFAAVEPIPATQADMQVGFDTSSQQPVVPVVAKSDPKADEAAIADVMGVVKQEPPFLAGLVPLPGRKPKAPEVDMASVAVPTPRPLTEGDVQVAVEPSVEVAALEPASANTTIGQILEQQPELQPDVEAVIDPTAVDPDTIEQGDIVASVPIPAQKVANPSATMRNAMLANADAALENDVKTTAKGGKPKAQDAKPGIKTVAKVPTPKIGKFALGAQNIAMANQPIAPEYAQALVRAAPTEVYMAGFSKEGPLKANSFSGKSVNFLRVAKFNGVK